MNRNGLKRNYRTPAIERLLAKCVEEETGCWRFTGYIMPEGYGQVRGDDGRTMLCHRVTFEYFRDVIPEGLVLDHLCRNRDCCNPWHAEPVPQRLNIKRGNGPLSAGWQLAEANLSKTHCPRGHEYTAGNTYQVPRTNHRQCRACKSRPEINARRRALRAEKKAFA